MKKKIKREFVGGPVVRTWHFTAGAWVQSLVGELRSPTTWCGQINKSLKKKK